MHDEGMDRAPQKSRMSWSLRTSKLRMVTRLLLTSFVVFLFPYFCFADFSGSVVSVLDGDTIEVLHNHRPERIRLSGIDCPEKGQAYRPASQASRLRPGLW